MIQNHRTTVNLANAYGIVNEIGILQSPFRPGLFQRLFNDLSRRPVDYTLRNHGPSNLLSLAKCSRLVSGARSLCVGYARSPFDVTDLILLPNRPDPSAACLSSRMCHRRGDRTSPSWSLRCCLKVLSRTFISCSEARQAVSHRSCQPRQPLQS